MHRESHVRADSDLPVAGESGELLRQPRPGQGPAV